MKKDIPQLKVEDIAIAAVPSEDPNFWDIYIINLHEEEIKGVLIAVSGYGEINGTPRKTATMRYFFEKMGALDMQLIEPLSIELFDITSEYWVSFSLNGNLYDKRYMFVPGSLNPINFIQIPFVEKGGVMLR